MSPFLKKWLINKEQRYTSILGQHWIILQWWGEAAQVRNRSNWPETKEDLFPVVYNRPYRISYDTTFDRNALTSLESNTIIVNSHHITWSKGFCDFPLTTSRSWKASSYFSQSIAILNQYFTISHKKSDVMCKYPTVFYDWLFVIWRRFYVGMFCNNRRNGRSTILLILLVFNDF